MTTMPTIEGRTIGAPEPSAIRLVLTLAVAGLVSGLAIVGAYTITKPIIDRNDAAALRRAVFKVVPGSSRLQELVYDPQGTIRARREGDGNLPGIYAAYGEDGTFRGYAIPGQGAGFQDVIKLIYGYDPAARRIIGMEVLDSRETPGLGDKIYKDEAFVANFADLAVEPPIVCVKHGQKTKAHEVDAITGATISSKAVTRIIGQANEFWLGKLPQPGQEPAPETRPEATAGEDADE